MSVELNEKTKLIDQDTTQRVYGENMEGGNDIPVEETELIPTEQNVTEEIPVDIPQMFDKTAKGRSTKYIRDNIMMKINRNGTISEKATTCFGDIEFRGGARRSMSKYIRISNDTPPEILYNLLIKYWKMDQPRLLISVTGGAKSFALDPVLKQNFTVGLSQVAATPGCWVISGGTNAGVMKHVGDALQGSNACIGIATWGILTKRERLTPDSNDDNTYVTETRKYEVGSWLTDDGAYLDNNHSHFILVDDGSEKRYGVEIPWRGKFEKFIMAKAFAKDKYIRSVPTVLLVVEGGPGTLGTIYSAVSGEGEGGEKGDPVPVVIVKQSGRIADVMVHALTLADDILKVHAEEETISQEEDKVHKGLLETLQDFLGPNGKDQWHKHYVKIVGCLKFKDSFTISNVGSEMDIDDAILQALLNDSKTEAYRQLQLSLVWNRADLARERIFLKMTKWEGDPRELQWITIMALAMNNRDFVQLLLDYGVSISSFLNEEMLQFLYGYRSYDKSSPLKYEFNDDDYERIEKGENFRTYKRLVGYQNTMTVEKVVLPRNKIEDLVTTDLCANLQKLGDERFIEELNSQAPDLTALMKADLGHQEKFTYPYRELFIWAIMNNMHDMAVLFWKLGEEHMTKALIATHICTQLAERRVNQNDIAQSLTDSATYFRNGAVGLLDQCYKTDDRKTSKLLTTQFKQFIGLDILKVAVASENLDFVSHYSVQKLIEEVWVGALKNTDVTLVELLFGWVFFPYINRLKFRTVEEIEDKPMQEDEYEEAMEEEEEEEEDSDEEKVQRQPSDEKKVASASVKQIKRTQEEIIDRGGGTPLTFCSKLYQFYTNTPAVKFVTHVLAYFAFLVLFSYTAMVQNKKTMPTTIEWLVIVTAFAYLVAEVYQVIQVDAPTVKVKLNEWAESLWNIYDAVVITMFFASMGLKLSHATNQFGHLLYTINCGTWWLRLLSIFVISPTLGPYLVMIKRMMSDLVKFLAILVIFILAYGVTSYSILSPSTEFPGWKFISGPIWMSYFNVYGELFAERDLEGNSTNRFGSDIHTPYDETVVWVLLGLYLLITNILLLNLLIAIFNDRYTEVQEKSMEIWKFKRYSLIIEYSERHFLFCPFSLLGHTWIFLRWSFESCVSCCGRKEEKEKSMSRKKERKDVFGIKSKVSDEEKEELLEFECDCMTELQKSKFESVTKTVEEMASDILSEVDKLKSDNVLMKEKLQKLCAEEKPTEKPSE